MPMDSKSVSESILACPSVCLFCFHVFNQQTDLDDHENYCKLHRPNNFLDHLPGNALLWKPIVWISALSETM